MGDLGPPTDPQTDESTRTYSPGRFQLDLGLDHLNAESTRSDFDGTTRGNDTVDGLQNLDTVNTAFFDPTSFEWFTGSPFQVYDQDTLPGIGAATTTSHAILCDDVGSVSSSGYPHLPYEVLKEM